MNHLFTQFHSRCDCHRCI